MRITLLCVGKTDFPFIVEGMKLYEDRLKHYCKFSTVCIPALKGVSSWTKEQIKEKEGELILKSLGLTKDKAAAKKHVVLLDERGGKYSSEAWASRIEKLVLLDKDVFFVIGGAYGFSDAVYSISSEKLSLSDMTFSHQIVRLIFMEQIYRAFTIISKEPYHHR